MNRGDIVIVSAPGDYGKPRPAVIIQSDLLNPTHASILVCLITSDIQEAPLFRLTIQPNEKNGLEVESQIMCDKIVAIKKERIDKRIGTLDERGMREMGRGLAFCVGLV